MICRPKLSLDVFSLVYANLSNTWKIKLNCRKPEPFESNFRGSLKRKCSRAVLGKIGQVKKWPSPVLKFHSNFESHIQSEYIGKFSDRSDDWNCFYRTRKVDDGYFFILCQIRSVWSSPLKDFEWFEVEWMCIPYFFDLGLISRHFCW